MLILNVVSHRNERVSLSRAPFLDTSSNHNSRAFRNYQHVIFNWYQQPQTYSCFDLSLVEKQEKNLAFTEEEMAWRHLSTVESLFSVSLLCNILTSLVPSLTNPWPSKTFELDEKAGTGGAASDGSQAGVHQLMFWRSTWRRTPPVDKSGISSARWRQPRWARSKVRSLTSFAYFLKIIYLEKKSIISQSDPLSLTTSLTKILPLLPNLCRSVIRWPTNRGRSIRRHQ